jgi:hypothetical protein
MKFLRNVAGYTLKDQIRNTVIRNELKIFSVNSRIQNNRLDWIHHVGRMEPERIPMRLMAYTPRGTRSIGRPMSRWKDQPIQQRNGTDRKVQTLMMMMMMMINITNNLIHVITLISKLTAVGTFQTG